LIESQEGLEAMLCEGSEASIIITNHKNKNKKRTAAIEPIVKTSPAN
jgi:hypothetical protein